MGPLSSILLSRLLEILARAVRQGKEIKVIGIKKEEVKQSLFEDAIILHVEISKDSIKKLLEQINEVSKVADYKINTKISTISIINKRISKNK